MKKSFVIAAALMIFVFALSGCGGSVTFEPTESSIFIRKDRHVVGAEIESFDNSGFETPRYSDTDLTEFVEDAVSKYNKSACGVEAVRSEEVETSADSEEEYVLPVSIIRINVENNIATLILDYKDCSEYLSFNGTSEAVAIQNLIVGTVKDGNDSDLNYENMIKLDEGTDAMPAEIMEYEDYMLVAIEGDSIVKVDGDIRYCTKGMEIIDENTVKTVKGSVNYIVFK